jgi:hypothetical protein
VGPRAGLDTEDRGKILFPCRGLNPDRPVVQPVVSFLYDFPKIDIGYLCEISDYYGGEYEVYSLLGCSAVLKLIDVSEVRTASIIRAMMMEAVRTFETSVNFDVTTRRYIPKYSKLNSLYFLCRLLCIFLSLLLLLQQLKCQYDGVDVSSLVITSCGLVGRYQRFVGTYCLHFQP